jgi:serine/threonine protein phosphatase PrpC
MSRCIGDTIAGELGIIAEPSIKRVELVPGRDKHMILASDGVWDVLSADDSVLFVEKYGRRCANV